MTTPEQEGMALKELIKCVNKQKNIERQTGVNMKNREDIINKILKRNESLIEEVFQLETKLEEQYKTIEELKRENVQLLAANKSMPNLTKNEKAKEKFK